MTMTTRNHKVMCCLLIAAAVLAGGSIWYACSADDEFETNYEIETLANGQMRVGAENGLGDSDSVPLESFYINAGSGTDTHTIGQEIALTVTLTWDSGDPGVVNVNHTKDFNKQIEYNQFGDILYEIVSSSFVHETVGDRSIEKDDGAPHGLRVIYSVPVYVTYRIYHYKDVHKLDYIEPKNNETFNFTIDASESASVLITNN